MFNLIRAFVRHPVAPNLAMLVMIIAGIWATSNLTRQLLPAFAINIVTISVEWPGASAEDVETSLTQPLEDALLGLDEVRNITSASREGASTVDIEYALETDMGAALDQVKNEVAQIRNLPNSAEEPKITLVNRNERVARVVLTGPVREQLKPIAERLERELRARGISRIDVIGLPQEEIAINIAPERLSEMNMSLQEVADRVRSSSLNVPAGSIGSRDVARQLRSEDEARTVQQFNEVPIATDSGGKLITLRDIADISRRAKDNEIAFFSDGRPAVELQINRSENEDALTVAGKMNSWLETSRADLPPNVELAVYDEVWRSVDDRIGLMLDNAISGLVLVLIVLYIFLNGRVAFWVAVGIPVSVFAALMALYLLGGTINVMTLFAMIMTFGIIVDDAIVVGEEAVTRFQNGEGPVAAAENAATSMFAPVTAASLTTVAAFAPLLAIGGPTGSILFAIPLVVICVVIASLIECFVVLPGHLRHSLQGTVEEKPAQWRRAIDVRFNAFREGKFKTFVERAINDRRTTLAIACAGIIVAIGLLAGGRIGFAFFPQPDGTTITASARFVSGSPPERMEAFLQEAVRVVRQIEADSGENFIKLVVAKQNENSQGDVGAHIGAITLELTRPDTRMDWSNQRIIREWQQRIVQPPGMEFFLIKSSRGGVPGSDLDISLTGAGAEQLKLASLDLQNRLREITGVSGVRDDLAYGKEQLIFELSPTGRAIGLTGESLGNQLRTYFEGELVQIFQDGGDDIEVRLRLDERNRDTLRSLSSLPVVLSDGSKASLANVAELSYARGFDDLKHNNGRLSVRITGDVDPALNNSNAIRASLSRSTMDEIANTYGVQWRYVGKAEEQSESVGGIGVALPLALLMIYIILAWVFGSYVWPIAVMSVIPFGLVGAIFGHWLLGFEMTMMSIFGIFGLMGIVINDSIILTVAFKSLREAGVAAKDAAVQASQRRLRAVLLTSLTTIVGVLPLLFETALQAQFLKPMVISLSFGLAFGTLIVLFLLPAMLTGIESLRQIFARVRSNIIAMLPEDRGAIFAGISRRFTHEDPASPTTNSNTGTKP